MFRKNQRNAGLGAGGKCICTSCAHSIAHQRGVACYSMTCPMCGAPMTREGINSVQNNNDGKPTVDENSCIGCGRCLNVCPVNAIEMVAGKAIIDHNKCIGCNRCIGVCPVNAIK